MSLSDEVGYCSLLEPVKVLQITESVFRIVAKHYFCE